MFLSYQPLVKDRQVGDTFGKTIDNGQPAAFTSHNETPESFRPDPPIRDPG